MSTMTETVTPTGAEFAQLDEARLAEVVRQAVGAGTDEAVEIASQGLETVAYEIGTISTCALLRASVRPASMDSLGPGPRSSRCCRARGSGR